jgi:hypothetical protein
MSNVIRFLETLGQNPAVSAAAYSAAVSVLDVDAGQKRALLLRDADKLNNMLQGRAVMRCMVATPD